MVLLNSIHKEKNNANVLQTIDKARSSKTKKDNALSLQYKGDLSQWVFFDVSYKAGFVGLIPSLSSLYHYCLV